MMIAAAIMNTISEIVIAILPVGAVFGLQVDPQQRWSVVGLLSLGFFVAFAGCFRTYYIWKTVRTYDMTWWSTPHWICSEVEIDTALVRYLVAVPLFHYSLLLKIFSTFEGLRLCCFFATVFWIFDSPSERQTS